MQIDRSKFLLLTTAISASVALAGFVGASGCSTSSTATDGGTTDASSSTTDGSSTDGSTTDAADGGEAGACLDDIVGSPTCEASGAVIGSTCQTKCTAAEFNFAAGVAAEIAPCILAIPSCDATPAAVTACIEAAIPKACPGVNASACTSMAATCSDGDATFLTKCNAIVPALRTGGLVAFETCVTEGGCATPIDTCIANLKN
jgi:hypothetical protein